MGPEEQYAFDAESTNFQTSDPNRMKRMIIGGALLMLFLLVLAIVLTAIFTKPSIRPQVTKVAATQTELARVAELGLKSTEGRRDTVNLAANAKAISLNNVAQLSLWSADNFEAGLSATSLLDEVNEAYDNALLQAEQVNDYDAVFVQAIGELLNAVNSEIATSFDSFADYPDLQVIMSEINASNSVILESIAAN